MTQIEILEAAIVAVTAAIEISPSDALVAAVAEIESQMDDLMFDMMADQYDSGYDEMAAGPDAKF